MSLKKSGQTDWDGRKVYQEAAAGNALCQEAIERMNRNLAQGLLNIQYLIDPDVISLGGSISQNPDFIKGVQKAVDVFVEKYEEYTIAPVISKPVPIRQMPISTVLLSTGYRRKTNGKFYRSLAPNKRKLLSMLKITFLYQM